MTYEKCLSALFHKICNHIQGKFRKKRLFRLSSTGLTFLISKLQLTTIIQLNELLFVLFSILDRWVWFGLGSLTHLKCLYQIIQCTIKLVFPHEFPYCSVQLFLYRILCYRATLVIHMHKFSSDDNRISVMRIWMLVNCCNWEELYNVQCTKFSSLLNNVLPFAIYSVCRFLPNEMICSHNEIIKI